MCKINTFRIIIQIILVIGNAYHALAANDCRTRYTHQAGVVVSSGPTVRIPGITTPTVLQLTGFYANHPQQWVRAESGPCSNSVTLPGTYSVKVNINPEGAAFWVHMGSITIPALAHYIQMSGPSPLEPSQITSVCLQSNAASYISSRNWMLNGADQFGGSGDAPCQNVNRPGQYSMAVTYHFGGQSAIVSTATIAIAPAATAPAFSLSKTAVDPVSEPPVCMINNFTDFTNITCFRDGSFSGMTSNGALRITEPGRYFLMGTFPNGTAALTNEFVIAKGSIPAPKITSDFDKISHTTPQVGLRAFKSNYNGGYTWFYKDIIIPNEGLATIKIKRPGVYKVTACATHSDGQTECKTSPAFSITADTLRVNEMVSRSSRVEGIISLDQMATLPTSEVAQVSTYSDGFGRPLQHVARAHSPNGKDLVTAYSYDPVGREYRKFLPFTTPYNEGKYHHVVSVDPQAIITFYSGQNDDIANTTAPYISTGFEASPLHREVEQGAAGEPWQPGAQHTVRKRFASNVDNGTIEPILTWNENSQGKLEASAMEPDGSLLITETIDENGRVHREFVDKAGRKILVESPGATATERRRTYYVYDDLGKLKFVLPPNFTAAITSTPFIPSEEQLKAGCFRYQFDERGRMIMKQIPGAEPVFFVHDPWDRVVLTQSGNQRAGQTWSFTKYDAHDRPVITGELAIEGDQNLIRQMIAGFYATADANPSSRFEEAGLEIMGYTNRSFPVLHGTSEVNTANYYDTYAAIPGHTGSHAFAPQADLELTAPFDRLKGLLTATCTRVLGTSSFILTVNYFDKHYRPIQVISDHLVNGKEIVSSTYDFEGKPLKNKRIHEAGTAITLLQENVFDFAGRLIRTYHRINDQAPRLVAQNHYNELGQLVKKNLHGDGDTFWQAQNFTYNIRGWLTDLNKEAETEAMHDDMYTFSLGYNEPMAGITSEPQFNGNICAYSETRPFEVENAQPVRSAYSFYYDEANRLKSARYVRPSNPFLDTSFDEQLTYDANSNIKTLSRNGLHDGNQRQIDNLSYTYNGNQLQHVNDSGDGQTGFRDVFNTIDYLYDLNGNLVRDENKGTTSIAYNMLDLPTLVTFNDGKKIRFTYTATGKKLRQVVQHADGSVKSQHDYIDGIIYRDGQIESVQHPEGRLVRSASGQWVYEYYLKDHLGNIRTTFTTDNTQTSFAATLEDETSSLQSNAFGPGYDKAAIYTSQLFNHTPSGIRSVRMSGISARETVGLAKSIRVMPGDKVSMEVYGKYAPPSGTKTGVNDFILAALTAAFNINPSASVAEGRIFRSLEAMHDASVLVHPEHETDKQAPKAFLNYILFDDNFMPYDGGFDQLDRAAREEGTNVLHDRMYLETGVIKKPGYIYVYLSNESEVVTDVYFDDMTITHTPSPIIESTTYYPFGMVASRNTADGLKEQRFGYNGKEHILEEGLDWYDYGARMYDAAIGRWHVNDPLADKYATVSPYCYALNDPMKHVDPDGKEVKVVLDSSPGGDKKQLAEDATSALTLIAASPTASELLLDALGNNNTTVFIVFTEKFVTVPYQADDGSSKKYYDAKYFHPLNGLNKAQTFEEVVDKKTGKHVLKTGYPSTASVLDGTDITKLKKAGKHIHVIGVSTAHGYEEAAYSLSRELFANSFITPLDSPHDKKYYFGDSRGDYTGAIDALTEGQKKKMHEVRDDQNVIRRNSTAGRIISEFLDFLNHRP